MITSQQNEQVKQVVSLHKNKGRKESGEYLIEGKRFVQEAFLRKAPIRRIFYTSSTAVDVHSLLAQAQISEIPVEEVSETVMKKMSATEEPQGILAIIRRADACWEDIKINKNSILLILDGVQDPGNLGSILRTALAADVKEIILTKGTVDLYNPKVLRSSMGTIFSQTILTEKTSEEVVNFCSDQHLTLAVSTMEGNSVFKEKASDDYPLALVIGNEASGVSEHFLKVSQRKYSIPMFNNVESLNAAMAAGIFLYELRREGRFL